MPTSLDDYGPFDAGIGASRTEDFWRALFGVALASGVLDGQLNEFAVAQRAAGANMSVDVATGRCLISGHWGESTVLKNIAISAAHATLPRIDMVILRADFSNNRVEIDVLTGTAAASPTVPALTRNTTLWEIAIGQIAVAAAAASIVTANITDVRVFMSADGPRRFPSTAARDMEITAPQLGDMCWVAAVRYEYTGTAWVAAGSGASMTLIATTTLVATATSIDFSSIPATYKCLRLEFQMRGDRAGASTDALLLRVNNDTAGNYDWQWLYGNNATAGAQATIGTTTAKVGTLAGATATANHASTGTIEIPNYAGTTFEKAVLSRCALAATNAAADLYDEAYTGHWRSTAAINRITLLPSIGPNFIIGSTVSLYGVS